MKKNLPIGMQTFEDLSKYNCVYVDKTEDIYRMISNGHIYFLSRPRRFGKSLLISTIEAVFQGRKELFEGLYIYDKWDWTQQNPVIRMDFCGISHRTTEGLNSSLLHFIDNIAKKYSISLRNHDVIGKFAELVTTIHKITGRYVVVLIDGYDLPVTDNISNEKVRDENHDYLYVFYQVLKGLDDHLEFIFITGVSIYNPVNSVLDITTHYKNVATCGFTQEELEKYFSEYIDETAAYHNWSREKLLDEIRKWYGGNSWNGKTWVYNPYSILSFFAKKHFFNFWSSVGTSEFIIKSIKNRDNVSYLATISGMGLSALSVYEYSLEAGALLFQNGYLTVKEQESNSRSGTSYKVGVPNIEVGKSIWGDVASAYTGYSTGRVHQDIFEMKQYLSKKNIAGFESRLSGLLEPVLKKQEAHALLLMLLKLLDFEVLKYEYWPKPEGDIAAVLHNADMTIVTEIKYSTKPGAEGLLDNVMEQIHANKYYEKYADSKIILMGVAYADKEVKCRLEELS
ncbi:MAG: AAA family ATPase [Prevotellaceae bacterium]|jgi:hypothetical protein|nr:AAA family ATPase [Prevotellaceae bacterium]